MSRIARTFTLWAVCATATPLSAQVTIDFEIPGAPCAFVDTMNLTDEYAHLGVHFSGPAPMDGGAVLDECGGFGVQAHSGVAFLAFNSGATLGSGGTPRNPETIRFDRAASDVSIWAGGPEFISYTMEAFLGNTLVDTHTLSTQSWSQLSVSSPSGIDRVVISSPSVSGVFVLDDLSFSPVSSVPYCTAKVNSLGCSSTISSDGIASASATSGFTVIATNVLSNKPGVLLYSVTGRELTPFQGGFLCIATPVLRTPAQLSGGSTVQNCTGGYRIDMNTFAAGTAGGKPHHSLSRMGTFVHCQWWSRDPGFAPPNAAGLSGGLQYMVGP